MAVVEGLAGLDVDRCVLIGLVWAGPSRPYQHGEDDHGRADQHARPAAPGGAFCGEHSGGTAPAGTPPGGVGGYA